MDETFSMIEDIPKACKAAKLVKHRVSAFQHLLCGDFKHAGFFWDPNSLITETGMGIGGLHPMRVRIKQLVG